MNQHFQTNSKDIITQAIQDMEKRLKVAIDNHTDFISQNGLQKQKLLDKINIIRQNELLNNAIESLTPSELSNFNQSYQNILNQIEEAVEKQKQHLAKSHEIINKAINNIQLVVIKSKESNLIGEDSQSKVLIKEIHSYAKSQEVQQALKILKWSKPNKLTDTVQDSTNQVQQYTQAQQDEADRQAEKQQLILDEAEKAVDLHVKDINDLMTIVEKSDFLGKTDHKKMIIDKLNTLIFSEELQNAVQTLGWKKTKEHPEILKAVLNIFNQIKKETKKQIKQYRQQISLEESINDKDHPKEPIDLNKLYADEDLADLRKLDQGHGMLIGSRIRLKIREQIQLKEIVDAELDPQKAQSKPQYFNVNTSQIHQLKLPVDNIKLKKIPVEIEKIDSRILVKVGPCDLSGVGGHHVRKQIIKDVVNQALKQSNLKQQYEQVNVSAVTSVRGRLQMFLGFFFNTRTQRAKHSNAYIKTDNEPKLTHWEPRNGPQSFFNDTICAMAIAVSSSMFEHCVRQKSIHSSKEATQKILKSPGLKKAFDRLLNIVKERISNLIIDIKKTFNISDGFKTDENITQHYKKKISENKTKTSEENEDGQLNKP